MRTSEGDQAKREEKRDEKNDHRGRDRRAKREQSSEESIILDKSPAEEIELNLDMHEEADERFAD